MVNYAYAFRFVGLILLDPLILIMLLCS